MTYIINLFCLFRNLLIIVSLTTLLNSNVNAVVENSSQANEIIIGDWQIAPKAYAFYVGPNQGSSTWWFNELSHVSKRSCFFDDIFRFNNDGSFENVMDGLTWLEDWQNPAGDSYCGTPQTPYNGSTAGQWTINSQATSLTISGVGAHVGLPKVINGSEIDNTNNAPSSITYAISELTDSQMTLDISVGFGWWGFELIKVSTDSDNDGYTDAVDAFPSNPSYHLDSDNDGMANSWEQQYGLNYLNPGDANSDLDNDNILAIDEFLNGTVPSASLDIDGNGSFDALTDGLLILRSLFGIENDSLTSGAVGNNSIYSSATEIQARISSIHSSLDIDNNGKLDALTDGLIILRYLFEMRSNSLIDGVISPTGNRSNLEDILTYFDTLIPADSDNDGVLDVFDLFPNDPTKIVDEDTSSPPEPEPITVPYDTPSQGLLDGT